MTEETKKEAIVAGALIVLIAWVLWHLWKSGQPSNQTDNSFPFVPSAETASNSIPPIPPITLPSSPSNSSCGCTCGGNCGANPYIIPDLNTILTNTVKIVNAINQAGDATIKSIANLSQQADPLLHVTVG